MVISGGRQVIRARLEDKVVVLVNRERATRRLPGLLGDERLRQAARQHSAEMARRNILAHQLPRGLDPFERMLAVGFPEPGGENVALGQETPIQVVRAWMQSPGHRANILDPDFRTIGVGVHLGSDGPWWTQDFGF